MQRQQQTSQREEQQQLSSSMNPPRGGAGNPANQPTYVEEPAIYYFTYTLTLRTSTYQTSPCRSTATPIFC